jgi:hypothetical protein
MLHGAKVNTNVKMKVYRHKKWEKFYYLDGVVPEVNTASLFVIVEEDTSPDSVQLYLNTVYYPSLGLFKHFCPFCLRLRC